MKIIKVFATIFVFQLLLAAPIQAGIVLEQSVDATLINTDSQNNTVTYQIKVRNDDTCKVPVDMVLTFDRSGSMKYDGSNPPEPITSAKQVSKSFVNQFRQDMDRVGLVSFSTNAKIEYPLSNNFIGIKNKIDTYSANGTTNILDALTKSKEVISQARAGVQKYIVLFSDGAVNGPTGNQAKDETDTLNKASEIKSAGIQIVTIALGQDADKKILQQMASSGLFYAAATTSDMAAIFDTLSKSLTGVSPDTVIWDDVSDITPYAKFVSASDGGIFNNDRITWNLGDLACGEERIVEYTFKFENFINNTLVRTNTIHSKNGLNQTSESNELTVTVMSPWLSATITDSRELISDKEIQNLIATITNTSQVSAENFTASITLPEYLSIQDTTIPGVTIANNILTWTIPYLGPGETLVYDINSILQLPVGITDGQIVADLTVVNDNQNLTVSDITKIVTVQAPPSYEIWPECFDNSAGQYTIYYSYLNNNSAAIQLDKSNFENPGNIIETNISNELETGRHEKAFFAKKSDGPNLTWVTTINNISKEAIASELIPSCTVQERDPEFDIFVNCIDLNADGTFTSYFGYENKSDQEEVLSASTLTPPEAVQNPIKIFSSGRHDKAFSAITNQSNTLEWLVQIRNISKKISSNAALLQCNPIVTPPPVDETPTEEPVVSYPETDPTPEIPPVQNPPQVANDNVEVVVSKPLQKPIVSNSNIFNSPATAITPVEKVDFNLSKIIYSQDCSTSFITLSNINFNSNSSISTIEYTLNNGRTWLPVNSLNGLGTQSVSGELTMLLTEEKLYKIKFRAITSSARIYFSDDYTFTKNCQGQIVILSYFYENGFGKGIIDNEGNYIVNTSLPTRLYVETLGPVQNLFYVTGQTELEFEYDELIDLWTVEIPAESYSEFITNVKVESRSEDSKVEKEIGRTLNFNKLETLDDLSSLKAMYTKSSEYLERVINDNNKYITGISALPKGDYTFEVFNNNGINWQAFPYESYYKNTSKAGDLKLNLFPGDYYVKVTYPSGKTYSTEKFSLTENSIARIHAVDETLLTKIPVIGNMLANLKVDIISSANTESPELQKFDNQKEIKLYKDLLQNFDLANYKSRKFVLIYWDRWDEFSSERLDYYIQLSNSNADKTTLNFVIFVDPKNYDEVKNILEKREHRIKLQKVTDEYFLHNAVYNSSEIILYDELEDSFSKIDGQLNLQQINNSLNDNSLNKVQGL